MKDERKDYETDQRNELPVGRVQCPRRLKQGEYATRELYQSASELICSDKYPKRI